LVWKLSQHTSSPDISGLSLKKRLSINYNLVEIKILFLRMTTLTLSVSRPLQLPELPENLKKVEPTMGEHGKIIGLQVQLGILDKLGSLRENQALPIIATMKHQKCLTQTKFLTKLLKG
jgi:hypothetical protein